MFWFLIGLGGAVLMAGCFLLGMIVANRIVLAINRGTNKIVEAVEAPWKSKRSG